MKCPLFLALALGLAACSTPPLPDPEVTGAASPDAPTVTVPYQSVMAGTAPHVPAELKPWRELNDSVAPREGRSP